MRIRDLAINTAIRKLRQALDDSLDHPKFIQTLPKRGYRFITAVNWLDSKNSDALTAITNQPAWFGAASLLEDSALRYLCSPSGRFGNIGPARKRILAPFL
jgi:DNA-binding winged helix-turn-helix (wHTH) protein